MDNYYIQSGGGFGQYGGPSAGCPCPDCVPPGHMPYAFFPDPSLNAGYGQQSSSRNAPQSAFGGFSPPTRSYSMPVDGDTHLREQLRHEVAEHERLFSLEEARLREAQAQREREEEAELLAELEQADREQEMMEAQLAEMQREDKTERRQARKEKGKSFLKRAWTYFEREADEALAYEQKIWEEFQQVKKDGGYLSDGRYVVPENKYHTAYALKPGEKPPLNLRADDRMRNTMRMFGMRPAT